MLVEEQSRNRCLCIRSAYGTGVVGVAVGLCRCDGLIRGRARLFVSLVVCGLGGLGSVGLVIPIPIAIATATAIAAATATAIPIAIAITLAITFIGVAVASSVAVLTVITKRTLLAPGLVLAAAVW